MAHLCPRAGLIAAAGAALACIGASARVSAQSYAEAAHGVTIEEAIAEALDRNPALLAERVNRQIAETAAVTARLRPNPVVSVSGDHLDWLGSHFTRDSGGGPTEFAWRIDVPLERGGKRALRMTEAAYDKAIADARLAQAIRALKLDVAATCLDVLQAKANLALQRENLRNLEELVHLNTVRVTAGSIAPFESTRSQVAMLQFRSTVARAELDLASAKTRLQNLLGRPPFDDVDVSGDLRAEIPQTDPGVERLQHAALAERADVRALRLAQARSQWDLKLQIAQGKVDYTIGSEYRRQQGINGKGNSLGFFFSAPLPLFNRNQGEIARAGAEREQTDRQIRALEAQVTSEVRAAYQEFTSTRALVAGIERDLLSPARSARDTSAYTYRAGGSSLLEFLDAQRAFNDTMQTYLEAQSAFRRAIFKLNSAVGVEVIP